MNKISDEQIRFLSSNSNISKSQIEGISLLVNHNYDKLKLLLTNMKNGFVYSVPSSLERVVEVLNMKPKSKWFSFPDQK
jgi:hypothetical protein